MSVPTHRARRQRRSSRRGIGSFVAVLALVIGSSSAAFAADNIFPDGDIATGGPNASFSGANCDSSIAGALTVSYNGNSDGGHFAAGESLTVDFSTVPAGVHITLGTVPDVPSDWGADPQGEFDIPFSTSVDAGSTGGKVEVTVTGNSSHNAAGDGAGGKPNFQVKVSCSTSTGSNNFAPVVSTDAQDTNGPEGSEQTNVGAFTDADGNSTLTISSTGAGAVTDNGDGTWSWSYTPADEGTGTVTVTASDGVHTDAVDTFDWTATNVNPVVAQPAFTSTSVDCTGSVTLGGISFSDPGVNDDPWTIDIDWGDGSTHDNYNVNSQGAQTNRSHTYNAVGTWTATVTVTDEDGGAGHNTSSNQITVNQTYSVDFLPPFDDSTPSGLIVNKMKNGRVVPVKATIYDDCTGAFVTDPTAAVTIKASKTSGTGTGDPVEEYADAGQSASNGNLFRWSSDGFWIYNLDSKALGLVVNNNYRVDIYVGAVRATVDDWAVLQPVK